MPFKNSTFFRPANGRYLGIFIGTEEGPEQTHKKDDGRLVTEGTMLWSFQIYDLQTRQPIVDPQTNSAPAVAQGMSSQTVGIGKNGVPAKARTWMSALLAANGRVFEDAMDPNEQIAFCLNAQVILNFGRSQTGKDGTLKDIEPLPPVNAAAPVAPVAVGAVAAIPPVE